MLFDLLKPKQVVQSETQTQDAYDGSCGYCWKLPMKEILAFIMLVALLFFGYGLIAGFLYGQSPYGLRPLIAGLLVAFAGLAGGFAAATIDRIE